MNSPADRIREALQFIPVGGHDERVRLAFMLKSEFGEAGRHLWDEWRDGRGDDEAASVWKSASETGPLKIGTLIHEAKANGWRDDGGHQMPTPEELAERRRIAAERALIEEAEIARERAAAADKATAIWKAAKPAPGDHAYLLEKSIPASGARLHGDALVIPMRDGGATHSLQFIGPDGGKRFLAGGRVTGCYFSIGNPKGAAALCIAEGFATGATIHEATGYPVAVAFNAGNLGAVAKTLRGKFPALSLILCGDFDKSGTGQKAATEAAQSVGGLVALPDFTPDELAGDKPPSDFNDLAQLRGAGAVGQAIAGASAPGKATHQAEEEAAPAGDSEGWPEPQPLAAKVEPEPYPIDALPDTIRAAVEEVAGFVKAPIPMVASSALAALSLAAQAHVDAKRAERLQGPVGLFLLTIADSGERKSTCDGFFVSAIRQYQDEQAEAMKPAIKEYQAAIAAWEAERDGILSAIKGAGKSGKATDKLRRDLAELQRDKPEPPRVPRLLLGDETPENLAWGLAKNWPSAGVVSAEAGIVFGAHGMGKDSVMRNLGLLNVLWDGGSHSVGRRTSESFTVKGARLTVALQVQEMTLRESFSRSGGLMRGTGFLARFLVAWPESTQGNRPFTEAPPNWPHLAAFHRRIAAILANPVPMDEEGALSPALMMLAPEAKAAWVAFHDAIESELASGGELYDVRDVASKSADNAARLGALFQIFEHGMGGAVGLDCFESASRIAAWHLHESRRFFGELALPAELADAARLDSWLIEYCKREGTHLVPTREAQRLGPIRDKEKLAASLRELEEFDRVRVTHEGRRKTIKVNPALVVLP
jgi:putative DNA primase/helicase